MVKAILFDIDNTLYSYDDAHAAAFRLLLDYVRRELGVEEEEFLRLHREADRLLRIRAGENCAAIHNRLIRYQIILEELGRPLRHAPRMSRLYWDTLLAETRPLPGMTDCVRRLRAAGYRLGIGSNMTAACQYAKLEKLDVLDQMDFIVTSEEAGAEKPDRKLFLLCAEKAGCPPEACVFVGDSLRHDALGALAARMRPVWLCPEERDGGETPEGVQRISSLTQLPELLPRL